MRRDEKARAAFVAGLRRHVFYDLSKSLRCSYENVALPKFRRKAGRAPSTAVEVRDLLASNEQFRFYSCLRVASQDLLYHCVRAPLERAQPALVRAARRLARDVKIGSLELKRGFKVPRSVSAIDIHLMPGSYHTEYAANDLTMGAVYEHRLHISTFGVFGPNLDDIGQSIARFLRLRHPEFRPQRILDLGCTVGHNTGAWKDRYPDAAVVGIDVAAPCLRYGAARARAQSRAIHFKQMNAEALEFPDASFDLVFSSMFLHEVPRQGFLRVLRECHRVLRPGGLMLHMELPPTSQLSPYDSFYLDWDGWYNNEPFYRAFRAVDPRQAVAAAGFSAVDYLQYVVPSLTAFGPARWATAAAADEQVVDQATGRLADGIRWFCFGAHKR